MVACLRHQVSQLTGRDAELLSSGKTGNISLSSEEFKTGI